MKGISIKSAWDRLTRSRTAGKISQSLGGAEARETLLAKAGYQGQPGGLAARLMVEVGRALPLALDPAALRGFGALFPGADIMAAARAEALSRYPAVPQSDLPASQVRLSPEEQASLWPWLSGQRALRLARSFVLSQDAGLAEAAVASLADFCASNPPLMGPGWADEQTTAIRVLNWLWCLRFLQDPSLLPQETMLALMVQMHLSGQILAEALLGAPEAGPLQAGPAGALLHLGRCLVFVEEADHWVQLGLSRLGTALASWSTPWPPFATSWAPLMLEWGGLSLWLCQKVGLDQPEGLIAGLRALGALVRAMAPPWGAGLAWGWSPAQTAIGLDQGRVDAASGAANLNAALLIDPDLRAGRVMDERLYWLFGKPAAEMVRQLAGGKTPAACHLPAAGLAMLAGHSQGRRVSLWLRTAPWGQPAENAPLWSAQALSLGLCLDGEPLLTTPGPAGSGPLASYLSSRAAYCAMRLDGQEPQSGQTVLEALEEDDRGAFAAARYDGYSHLNDPVIIRRRLFLDKHACLIQIVDQLQADGEHDCEIFYHLPAHAEARITGGGLVEINGPWGQALMFPEAKATLELIKGRANPPLGWHADQAGRAAAAPAIRLYARVAGSARLTTSLALKQSSD